MYVGKQSMFVLSKSFRVCEDAGNSTFIVKYRKGAFDPTVLTIVSAKGLS